MGTTRRWASRYGLPDRSRLNPIRFEIVFGHAVVTCHLVSAPLGSELWRGIKKVRKEQGFHVKESRGQASLVIRGRKQSYCPHRPIRTDLWVGLNAKRRIRSSKRPETHEADPIIHRRSLPRAPHPSASGETPLLRIACCWGEPLLVTRVSCSWKAGSCGEAVHESYANTNPPLFIICFKKVNLHESHRTATWIVSASAPRAI